MNSKGGCGKTTIATNLASYYTAQGFRSALFDYDPQASSMTWLKLRHHPNQDDDIDGIAAYQSTEAHVTRAWQLRVPHYIERVIIDTPAGLTDRALVNHVQGVDVILIPVLPSPIDIQATADFIRDLLLIGHARSQNTRIGIIANRVKVNTQSYRKLESFLQQLDIPMVTRLRDTQHYLRAVEQGSGIAESKDNAVHSGDRMAWHSIMAWLERKPVETIATSGGIAMAGVAAAAL